MATLSTPSSSRAGQGPPAPRLGAAGDTCRGCSALLATDQRYCLNCGARRADAPLRFLDEPGTAAAVGADVGGGLGTAAGSPVGGSLPRSGAVVAGEQRPVVIIAAVATMLLALGVGVLIGNAGDGDSPRPTIVRVAGSGATPAPAPSAAAPFTSDWPSGKEGFTVALQELPKSSTQPAQVAAAKSTASSSGASAVGALDADAHPSLDPGAYVVYSGVFDTRKQAVAALADLAEAFPDARVVRVGVTAARTATSGGASAGERSAGDSTEADPSAPTVSDDVLKQQENAPPEVFQKQSKKLPDKVQSEGPPPPVDDAPAGDGGEAETFG